VYCPSNGVMDIAQVLGVMEFLYVVSVMVIG